MHLLIFSLMVLSLSCASAPAPETSTNTTPKPSATQLKLQAWQAEAHTAKTAGNLEEASGVYTKMVTLCEVEPCPPGSQEADLRAEAMFFQIKTETDAMRETKIEGNIQELRATFKAHLDELQAIKSRYKEVKMAGSQTWRINATVETAKCFEHLSKLIRNADVQGLTPAQRPDFDKQLVNLAGPLERTAAANYEAAIKEAKKHNISTPWTTHAKERLKFYYAKYRNTQQSAPK